MIAGPTAEEQPSPTRAELRALGRGAARTRRAEARLGRSRSEAAEPGPVASMPSPPAAPPPRTGRPRRRADTVLALVAAVLVVVAVGLGVVAFLVYRGAQDDRAAAEPLEARAAALRVDLAGANRTIDRLTALFAAIRAQADATKKAVDATNQAAAHYNRSEGGIADALGTDAAAAVTQLTQATTAVRTAADEASSALAALGGGSG